MAKLLLMSWGCLLVGVPDAMGAETARLITYGPGAASSEGDNDHEQEIYFLVPAGTKGPLWVRIWDADCGGDHDQIGRDGFGTTRFELFGGEGAWTTGLIGDAASQDPARPSGVQLREADYSIDPALNNDWSNFAKVEIAQGEAVGDEVVFRLLIRGIAGSGGNVYDVALSSEERHNVEPPGVRILSPALTFRQPEPNRIAELPFFVPQGSTRLRVANFDVVGTEITLETAYRTTSLDVSPQGEAATSLVALEPIETGRMAALTLIGLAETPNDATFWVATEEGERLMIQLPVHLRPPNRRPVLDFTVQPLADCDSVLFDASGTADRDADSLMFLWEFGEGAAVEGSNVVHRFPQPGVFEARITVRDDSGHVGNGVTEALRVTVNHPPVARIAALPVLAPGQQGRFDGSGSDDQDGSIGRFDWDFDDGSTGSGSPTRHAFEKPGIYRVELRVQDDSSSPCNLAQASLDVKVNAAPVAEA